MQRELWLLRHGKSDWNVSTPDYDRPLKKRGLKDSERLGAWLRLQHLCPELVISSPALRALTTAKIVCQALSLSEEAIRLDKRIYDEGVERLKKVLADVPEQVKTVLLVGHNPELESLVRYLVPADCLPMKAKLLPTATLFRLKMPDLWSDLDQGCADIIAVIFPKALIRNII
jgi:phosphohistidine phosphatase